MNTGPSLARVLFSHKMLSPTMTLVSPDLRERQSRGGGQPGLCSTLPGLRTSSLTAWRSDIGQISGLSALICDMEVVMAPPRVAVTSQRRGYL